MHSKLISTVFLLAALFVSTMTCAQTQRLVVWHKDGQKTYYDLAENPKTTFSGTDIVITTSSITINYPLDQILRYTYELQTSGIEIVNHTKPVRVSQNSNEIVFENLKENTRIQVFSLDGKQLSAQMADGQRTLTVSLASYPAGVYIVKANGATYKMTKK